MLHPGKIAGFETDLGAELRHADGRRHVPPEQAAQEPIDMPKRFLDASDLRKGSDRQLHSETGQEIVRNGVALLDRGSKPRL
jgi:hypothetical protein